MEPGAEKSVEVRATLIDDVEVEDEYIESHYMKPHWT